MVSFSNITFFKEAIIVSLYYSTTLSILNQLQRALLANYSRSLHSVTLSFSHFLSFWCLTFHIAGSSSVTELDISQWKKPFPCCKRPDIKKRAESRDPIRCLLYFFVVKAYIYFTGMSNSRERSKRGKGSKSKLLVQLSSLFSIYYYLAKTNQMQTSICVEPNVLLTY